MNQDSIKLISEAIVREYLDSYDLKKTMKYFDFEKRRQATSNDETNSRSNLLTILNLQNTVQEDSKTPLKSVLDLLLAYALRTTDTASLSPRRLTPQQSTSDILIDDDIEGETMLGEGRIGVIYSNQHNNNTNPHNEGFGGLQPKPAQTKTSRRGVAGPIGSGGLKRGTGEAIRQWKSGPALLPDTRHKLEEHMPPPPQRLEPIKHIPATHDHMPQSTATASTTATTTTTNKSKRSKKSSNHTNSDSIQDALAKIKNARKKQPGALFLSHNDSRDVSVSDLSRDASDINVNNNDSGNRLKPIEYLPHDKVNKKHKSRSNELPPESHTFMNESMSEQAVNTLNDFSRRNLKKPIAHKNGSEQDCVSNETDNNYSNDVLYGAKSDETESEQQAEISPPAVQDSDTQPNANSFGFKQLTAELSDISRKQYLTHPLSGDYTNDDLVTSVSPVLPVKQAPAKLHITSKPIDLETAIDLKRLIFSYTNQDFSDEWKYQSFCFSDLPKLQYLILQKRPGPCGIIAAVQAFLLQRLLFTNKAASTRSLQPSTKKRGEYLAEALAQILWRAGQQTAAIVSLPTEQTQFLVSSRFKADKLTETLMLFEAYSYEDLTSFIKLNIAQFELDGASGAILCLYSTILSRTMNGVRLDMDSSRTQLLVDDLFCSQELVNLLLTGNASSNVFNDTLEQEGEGSEVLVRRGATSRCDIGLLTLKEHYKKGQVGTYLKVPRLPIWLTCLNSHHYGVLFSLNKELMNNWRAERRFDLYLYDGLLRHANQVKLTIITSNASYRAPTDEDIVTPIEFCIRTKWPDAEIDWNGTEPIF